MSAFAGPGSPDRGSVLRRLKGTVAPADPSRGALTGLASRPSSSLARQLATPAMPAAVLVALLERGAGGLEVVFTQRAEHLKNHPGQVSFPGGRIEPHDRGPADAALREAQEEIGLCPRSVEIAGYLDAQLTVSGFAVTPVVGVVHEAAFTPRPDPTEVAEVFVAPLAFFLDPGNRRCGFRDYQGSRFEVIEYHWEGRRIWGATASMLVRLVAMLQESGPR